MNRRKFLLTATGAAIAGNPMMRHIYAEVRTGEDRRNMPLESTGLSIRDGVKILKKGEKGNVAPVLREEILDNPNAVFIIYAGIKTERDETGEWKPCANQLERFGHRVAELVFRTGTEKGGRTFIHPNMVGGLSKKQPVTFNHGGIVHPYFTTGFVEGLRNLGNTNTGIGVRGGLRHSQVVESGLEDLFASHNIPFIEAHTQYFKDYHRSELNWHHCPEGIVQKRFSTYKPAYDKGTTYINIAHAHTHWVGHTTLSIKNNQGIMPRGYGHICDDWTSLSIWRGDLMDDFNGNYRPEIEASYIRHANMGYKHWDHGGYYATYKASGGYPAFNDAYHKYRQTKQHSDERKQALERLYEIADHRLFLTEIWAQRMMDIIEVLPPPYVSMVEGVFGRGSDCGIIHSDFLTVSRSMVAIDTVTSWLMGHDPRELPYLRIAKERGLSGDPVESIPIYLLDEKGITRIKDYRMLRRYSMGVQVYGLKGVGVQYY
ncbi:MAG: DUF362 domain-containing protein [Candidatus Latescibacteria bacterium]|nr:DUF362 domain-containing protein [Candidatus Latescibacterota bacterium]